MNNITITSMLIYTVSLLYISSIRGMVVTGKRSYDINIVLSRYGIVIIHVVGVR